MAKMIEQFICSLDKLQLQDQELNEAIALLKEKNKHDEISDHQIIKIFDLYLNILYKYQAIPSHAKHQDFTEFGYQLENRIAKQLGYQVIENLISKHFGHALLERIVSVEAQKTNRKTSK